MRAAKLALAVLLATCILTPAAWAGEGKGKLESFEEGLKKPSETKSDTDSGYSTDTTSSISGGDIAAQGLMSIFYNFFLMGLATGGAEDPRMLYEELKLTQSPALPTIRIEPSYHYVINDVNAAVGRIEAGYLSFGADFEYMRYFERNAPDLDVLSGHLLLRTLFARFIGVNLALGVKSIWGSGKHTGFEFGVPFYVYFTKHLILDVLPYFAYINSRRVYDVAGGFSVKYGFVGARAYYRALYNGSQTLHGPGVGVFIQW